MTDFAHKEVALLARIRSLDALLGDPFFTTPGRMRKIRSAIDALRGLKSDCHRHDSTSRNGPYIPRRAAVREKLAGRAA